MKAVLLVALVAITATLAVCASACTVPNRRSTIWAGLPGPDGSSTNSVLIRVYRTDKFNYNIDTVDATVSIPDGKLTKAQNTKKSRTSPATTNLGIYSLVNDTRIASGEEPAFMVLKELKKGVFEIKFRAHYVDFPMVVDPEKDLNYWISESLQNFYFLNSTGDLMVVQNISGSQRDFDVSTSNWTIVSIKEHLRNESEPTGIIGKRKPILLDSALLVGIVYGADPACEDGMALFHYDGDIITYIGDQPGDASGGFLDGTRKWWVYTGSRSITITDYSTNTTLLQRTFTEDELKKIISRVKLAAWVAPLATLIGLWIGITIFCAMFCRERC